MSGSIWKREMIYISNERKFCQALKFFSFEVLFQLSYPWINPLVTFVATQSIHLSFFIFSGNIVPTLHLCLAGLIFFWLIDLWPHMTIKFEHFFRKLCCKGASLSRPFLRKYPLYLFHIFMEHCPYIESVHGRVYIFLTHWPLTSHDLKEANFVFSCMHSM